MPIDDDLCKPKASRKAAARRRPVADDGADGSADLGEVTADVPSDCDDDVDSADDDNESNTDLLRELSEILEVEEHHPAPGTPARPGNDDGSCDRSSASSDSSSSTTSSSSCSSSEKSNDENDSDADEEEEEEGSGTQGSALPAHGDRIGQPSRNELTEDWSPFHHWTSRLTEFSGDRCLVTHS